MKYRFMIDGETPSKKNSRINLPTGVSIPSKRYREWHDNASAQILLQKRFFKELAPIKEPCTIKFIFTHGDLRRRDSDNGVSSVLDLLTDCGILEDDNWYIVRNINVINVYEKRKPECCIEITVNE